MDPGSVMNAVDQGATRLEAAADAYYKATLRYEKAENEYQRQFQKALLVAYHKSLEAKERPPAEDLRRAIAHDAIDAQVYGEYLEAKAEKEALAVRYRALSAAVSARQSLLKALSGVGA